jgi:hypothetical protein
MVGKVIERLIKQRRSAPLRPASFASSMRAESSRRERAREMRGLSHSADLAEVADGRKGDRALDQAAPAGTVGSLARLTARLYFRPLAGPGVSPPLRKTGRSLQAYGACLEASAQSER